MQSERMSAFGVAFAETLSVELRRQGVARVSECVSGIIQGLRVTTSDGNEASAHSFTVCLGLASMGLGDREVIAVAETLLKLFSPIFLKTHKVSHCVFELNDNSFTDRSVGHLSLLLSRCSPPLEILDLRGITLTADSLRHIEEARLLSSKPCMLRLTTSGKECIEEGNSELEGSSVSRVLSVNSVVRRGVDTEALQKRRSALFGSARRSRGENEVSSSGPVDSLAFACVGSSYAENKLTRGYSDMAAVGSVIGGKSEEVRHHAEKELEGHGAVGAVLATTREKGYAQQYADMKANERKSVHSMHQRNDQHQEQHQQQQQQQQELRVDSENSPLEDDEEPLDVTANLSPLLKSVVDLSNTVLTGKLRALHGTDDIWEVIESYSVLKGETGSRSSSQGDSLQLSASLTSAAAFQSLTVLSIGQNGLTSLRVLPPSLLRLDVSGNNLRELTGLDQCRMLTLLNARHNLLSSMLGLERNLALSHLFLSHNKISFVDGIAHLILLETLDLAHNNLKTQASIRPLSLSKGLQHVMLRGNPVMERIKGCYRPLLRNLCPSLLFIDGNRLSYSRAAANAQIESNRLRLPYAPHGIPISSDISLVPTEKVAADESQCANYMHLLTRGATSTLGQGYSNTSEKTRIIQNSKIQNRDNEKHGRTKPSRCNGGEPLRKELLKQLAQQSKKYLESVLVERLSVLQSSCVADVSQQENIQSNGNDNEFLVSSKDLNGCPRNSLGNCEKESHEEPHLPQGNKGRQVDLPVTASSIQEVECTSMKDHPFDDKTVVKNTYATTQRDETLNHDQWMKVRDGLGARGVLNSPFGDTPDRELQKTETPEKKNNKSREDTVLMSPIRPDVDESHAISANITQILCDMDMLESQTGSRGTRSYSLKEKPRMKEATVRRPLLLSPSSASSPVKAYQIRSSSCSSQCIKRVPSSSLNSKQDFITSSEPVIFSPPPPLMSLRVDDTATRERFIRDWVTQLYEDAESVHEALRTLVSLFDTEWSDKNRIRVKSSFSISSLRQERQQCIDILAKSGMLLDTEVPVEVVDFYRFTSDELNGSIEEEIYNNENDQRNEKNILNKVDLASERSEVLRCIHLIGDGKTCLRYIVLLIEEEKENELQRYVDEVKTLIFCD
ncbi:uncharacterized protein TM35_000012610 [Trypanosoma theileri]|uniref:Leucine-rich repeat protein (LRRP) n=1 Tax=Trypanosoma theileri TaxID=67003 RepID=A0A1X0P8X3_9TRYP|nr:uncharacterized protein TM35_000012610 [Trypanosoma theileri]ORC93384.1 hypothetical protein TM35_000012610 [Trypanosoma theileri]